MKKRIVLIMILASLAACSGGGGSGSPSGGAADIAAAHQLFDLDRVRVTDGEILDSSGRQVILRGLVTITLNVNLITGEVQRPDLTSADYERMRAWGFNAQVIRLEGGRLGLNPDQPVDAAYLGLLASWTNLAAQQGIHTVFKMTTYDVPGWGWNNAFNPARWQAFWDNEGGQQDQFLAGWRNVWRYFAGWTAVIGYDILNEPHAGTRTTPFVSQYLKPFYNRASQALRQTDGEVALIFQPPVTGGELSLAPDDPHPFFAPHIYPSSLDQIGVWLGQYANNAALMNTPIAVMEYGLPDNEFSGMLTWTLESERLYAARFDEYGVGCFRVWYAYTGVWNVLNADGSESKEKFDVLSRPYPQRVAGTVRGWSFDFDSRVFQLVIEPRSGAQGSSEIFVPLRRHFPEGFMVDLNGGRYFSDEGQPSGLRAAGGGLVEGLSFDFATEILEVGGSDEQISLTISPL